MEEHRGAGGHGHHAGRACPCVSRARRGALPLPARREDPDEGSNMWAVAPSRTTTGHAMLLINPHVGFFGGGQRYEAHLHSGEGLDVSGFAILGTPYIRSGHNRYLGWSHTNNYASTVGRLPGEVRRPGRSARVPLWRRPSQGNRMERRDSGKDRRPEWRCGASRSARRITGRCSEFAPAWPGGAFGGRRRAA